MLDAGDNSANVVMRELQIGKLVMEGDEVGTPIRRAARCVMAG